MTKYALSSSQTAFQPGSNDEVLANKLGITTIEDINDAETELLLKLYEYVFVNKEVADVLCVDDIKYWHKLWLGNVYPWAGEERAVNMAKGDFTFAAATRIPELLVNYEQGFLSQFAELGQYSEQEFVAFLAQSHVEFILIHPFREGNGRISRLLADVIAVKAGFGLLDYSLWDTHKDYYFKAIQAGAGGNNNYMERLIRDALCLNGES